MALVYDANNFLELGLLYHGWNPRQIEKNLMKSKLQHFADRFYVGPQTCEDIFNDLKNPDIQEAQVDRPNPKYMLLALNHLKEYAIEGNLSGLFHMCKKTATKWVDFYVEKISALKEHKVSL
jgi:hypothetical protein